MSFEILKEADFFLESFLAGVWMIAAYDIFRILRRLVPHGTVGVAVEDFLYWFFSIVYIFRMIFLKNDGSLRIFSMVGIFIGFLFYHLTISEFLLKYVVGLLKKLQDTVKKMFRFFKKGSGGRKHEKNEKI